MKMREMAELSLSGEITYCLVRLCLSQIFMFCLFWLMSEAGGMRLEEIRKIEVEGNPDNCCNL
jgi:hypothetical protein